MIRLFSLALAMLLSGMNIASLDGLDADMQGLEDNVLEDQEILLSQLPCICVNNIFSYLNIDDLCRLSRTCRSSRNLICNHYAVAKVWFSRLSIWQKSQLKSRAAEISEDELRAFIKQFGGDEKVADDLVILKNNKKYYFPYVLFHTVSGLMSNCYKFRLERTARIADNVFCARFNYDGRHAVIMDWDNTVMIFSMENDGQWMKKATVPHEFALKQATFRGDASHVETTEFDDNATIWGLGMNGEWSEKFTFTIVNDDISVLAISDNCRYMVVRDGVNISILGLGATGEWTEKTFIINVSKSRRYNYRKRVGISFSSDSTHVMITGFACVSSVWGMGMDGKWERKALLAGVGEMNRAIFSASGSHILMSGYRGDNKIWGRNEEGEWVNTATMIVSKIDLPSAISAKDSNTISTLPSAISANGLHVVITDGCKRCAMIYSQIRTGHRTGQWVSTLVLIGINTVDFSSDSCHLVFGCRDNTVRVWSLGGKGIWTEKGCVIIPAVKHKDNGVIATFSTDSRYIMAISGDRKAEILKLNFEDKPLPPRKGAIKRFFEIFARISLNN
ncbi:MAG: F-box protein [Candidatus Endonucleobacter bathymodioli]|uniref:F-box protein n=1 Tax=Candidatus Endonucleibacter bathymodioli TaxID=539814 RepID=A0AA90NN97_9GAMM|nr:F-box protein [Candidatus Endonucleobacter bathymodioli]